METITYTKNIRNNVRAGRISVRNDFRFKHRLLYPTSGSSKPGYIYHNYPLGGFKYQRLPIGVVCAPDIFQEKMITLTEGLEYVRTYLDDLLVLSLGSFEEHLQDV